jgi:hypothetical protein
MADMPKSSVKQALASAKRTREKVRKKIKNNQLGKIPPEIDIAI